MLTLPGRTIAILQTLRLLPMTPSYDPDMTPCTLRPPVHRAVQGEALTCCEPTTISCPSPVAWHSDAATRLAMRSSGSVTIGQPAHRTSQPVVCALHSGVSRNTSAMPDRRMCSCAQDHVSFCFVHRRLQGLACRQRSSQKIEDRDQMQAGVNFASRCGGPLHQRQTAL